MLSYTYLTASCAPPRDGIESRSKSIPVMPLHSLPSLANPRAARVARASSPYRFARTWAQRPRAQGDPSSSVLRDLATTRATRCERRALNWRLSGTRPPGMSVPRSSRDERGRLHWSQTDGRGRREQPRRVLGYPLRLGDRIVGDAVEGVNMLRHVGRPIAELGRDATEVSDQVRRLKAPQARERAEPSAHRLIELSPRSYRAKRLGVSRGRRTPRRAGRCRRLRSRSRSRFVDGLSSSG